MTSSHYEIRDQIGKEGKQTTHEELIQFWTGNPFNNIWNGHVLLRAIEMSIMSSAQEHAHMSAYLCCPFVPIHMQIIEFCQFIESYQREIKQVRVLKSAEPNEYMIAIKFSSKEDLCIVYELLAANIKSEKNHHSSSSDDSPRSPRDKEQPASQSEESVIINTSSKVIPVGIAFMTPKERVSLTKKLQSSEVLFQQEIEEQSNCPICLESLVQNENGNSVVGVKSPPVQESSGAPGGGIVTKMKQEKLRGGENDFNLTILCCHTFHWMCIKNWNDTTCPLCRYPQSPTESSQCEECGATENLWLCLICGLVGCFNVQAFQNNSAGSSDRFGQGGVSNEGEAIILSGQGHSLDHFRGTKHTYSMEIYSHNVWDFCKQNYVHRLIQNQVDGKLVEFGDPIDNEQQQRMEQEGQMQTAGAQEPNNRRQTMAQQLQQVSSAGSQASSEKEFMVDSVHRYNKKLESLNYEYNQMLAQTLENQRAHFERRLMSLNQEEELLIKGKKEEILQWESRLESMDKTLDERNTLLNDSRERFNEIKGEYGKILTELLKTEMETKRLRELNEKHSHRIEMEVQSLKEQIQKSEKEIAEIKLDKNDILNHIKMSQKIKKSKNSAEIAQSQTLIFDTSSSSKRKKK